MLKRDLHLSWRNVSLRGPCAWLITGRDPAQWLEEIEAWELRNDHVKLHVIPDGSGVLVELPDNKQPAHRPRACPFGRFGPILLPVDAELLPAVSESELRTVAGSVNVIYHPTLGLIVAEAPIGLADLLVAPAPLVVNWSGAIDVPRSHPRIESIGLRTEPSLDDVIEQGRDDIATERPEGMPDPDDQVPDGALNDGLRGLKSDMLRGLRWLIRKMPSGQLPGPLDRAERWLGSKLEKLGNDLGLMRNRALARLLEQLKSDPEEGLRRALPLGSLGAHRGIAPPSASLGNRNTNFRLSNLAGGGPRDGWDVPPEMLRQLRLRYFELAERERKLGRFRRSAYIYAELLTDLDAAAKVLCEGGFWAEAAIVYRDHLRNPVQAAHCFVEARLLHEAIVIYERHALYAEIAALYRKIGKEDRAVAALRRWVKSLLDRSDRLHAAEVLITHLHEREEALALLENAWPTASDALACMHRAFELYGQAAQHAATRQLLDRIRKEPNKIPIDRVIELLASLQQKYPDRTIRQGAEDLGLRMVASRIEGTSLGDQMVLMRSLSSLAPDDHLLARDGHRFLDHQRKVKSLPATRPETGKTTLTRIGETKFTVAGYRWVTAIGSGAGVAALAVQEGQVVIAFGSAEEQQAAHLWKVPGLPKDAPGFLASHPLHPSRILPIVPGNVPLPDRKIPALFGWDPNLMVGQPSWYPVASTTATVGADGTLWVVRLGGDGNAMLTGYSPTGVVRGNILLNDHLENAAKSKHPDDPFSLHLAFPGDDLILAAGKHIHRFRDGNPSESCSPLADFEEPILSLAVPPRWAKPHVACVLQTEVHVCWLGSDGVRTNRVLGELEAPKVCFASDGVLVIIAEKAGFLADVDSRGRQRLARFEYPGGTPVAIITGFMARTFGVLDSSGTVAWWKFAMEDLR